jgi:hypothetical protein
VNIDPVQHGTRQSLPEPIESVREAAAVPPKIAVEPARARVRRCDQGEPGGELDRAGGPRHHDPAILHGLTQPFDGVAAKLGELVKEKNAVVGQGGLSRPEESGPAAEKPGG